MVHPKKVNLEAIARKAMKNYGFEAEFPPAVTAQVNGLESRTPGEALRSASDLRNLLWSSIDNSDTMDLDQIEYCERGRNGGILVKVAIADVDAYVPKGSITDMHAAKNTTSVYTGISVFPMLPDHLSKDISSLVPGGDRLAIVIEFDVRPTGEVRLGKVYRALVRNKAKLVYEEVGAWLEGRGEMPKTVGSVNGLEAQLRLQYEASLQLEKYRNERGALELETLEARAVIQKETVLDFLVVRANPARYIIENFMVAANGVVSGLLKDARIPMIQRVVRTPKYWAEIVDVAKAHGTMLPRVPDAKALSRFLAEQKKRDPERFPDLSLTVVKLLGPGEYVMYDQGDQLGHFCLAVASYTHATAPNRRYVDLVIQRLLKTALGNAGSPYGKDALSRIAARCTERQKESKKVERFMIKVEATTLLAGKIGSIFDAIITGSSDKGVYARLASPPVEGRVTRGMAGLRVGQKTKVKLIGLDPEQGHIDFERVR
jgi:VacB/RNase II family 3'-5' exoribonuclease